LSVKLDHIICKKCGKSGHANAKNRLCSYSKKYEPPATETRGKEIHSIYITLLHTYLLPIAGNNQDQIRPTQAPTNGPKSAFHRGNNN
jgi:hypothetical protein